MIGAIGIGAPSIK